MADNNEIKQQIRDGLSEVLRKQIGDLAKAHEELQKREQRAVAKRLKKSNGALPKTPGLQPVGDMAKTNGLQMCTGCGKPHQVGKCMGKSEIAKAALPAAAPASKPRDIPPPPPSMAEGKASPKHINVLGKLSAMVQQSVKAPALPGLTPKVAPRSVASKPSAAPATSVEQANKEMGGFKSIASNPTAMPGGQLVNPSHGIPISGGEKRAAGIGFVGGLISKIKGTGNQGWEESRGTGNASAGRVAATAGRRLALSEKSLVTKATVAEVNQEMKGFKSIASSPTKMPMSPGLPKPASFKGAPSAFKNEKPENAQEGAAPEAGKGQKTTKRSPK